MILLLRELGERASRTKIQIFGTDIQEHAVSMPIGIYTQAAVTGVSPARLKSFFVKTDHEYQIRQSLRDLCVFARHDVTGTRPFQIGSHQLLEFADLHGPSSAKTDSVGSPASAQCRRVSIPGKLGNSLSRLGSLCSR